MTQKANPSINRPAEAFKTAGAIAYGGHGSSGFIIDGSNPTDISVQDVGINHQNLEAFRLNNQFSSTSFDVVIDPGEAFVFGSWICIDVQSTITLASDTVGQTVFVGWNKSGSNDVIVGLESAFSNASGDTDEKIPLYTFDTDVNGVTNVVDERSFDQISADSVEDAFVENTGDTVTGDISMSGTNTITDLTNPVSDSDAATKQFTESVAQGLTIKSSVRVSNHDVNIDLSSSTDPNPIDGITLNDGDRILLKHQTDKSENGIYDAVTATDPTTWVRSDDFDEDAEVTQGSFTFVRSGTHANESYVVITPDPITVGTDNIEFAQFASAGQLSGGTNVSVSGDVIDVSPQGTGSGLDADTVDGIEASNLGSSVSDSGTSITDPATTINFTGNINASNSATTGQADISLNNNSVTITSGDGLNGGGNISLGNSTTISVDVSDFTGSGLTPDGNNNIDLSNDSISVSTGTDLTGGGTVSLGGSISISHQDTSTQSNVSTGGNTVIDDINLDGNGHVTNMNTENRSLNDWTVPNDFNINNASKIGLPHRSSDPGANPGDMWYRTDLD